MVNTTTILLKFEEVVLESELEYDNIRSNDFNALLDNTTTQNYLPEQALAVHQK